MRKVFVLMQVVSCRMRSQTYPREIFSVNGGRKSGIFVHLVQQGRAWKASKKAKGSQSISAYHRV
jgi:hypothetical protein